MKNVLIAATLCMTSCGVSGYQWSPYVELQHRDEEFSGHGTIQDDYTGNTLMFGARLIPDTRIHPESLLLLRASPAVPPIIIDHGHGEGDTPDAVDKLIDKTDTIVSDATWPVVGALLAIALIIWVLRRKSKAVS